MTKAVETTLRHLAISLIGALGIGAWLQTLGVPPETWAELQDALVTTAVLFVLMSLDQLIERVRGGGDDE